MGPNSTIVLLRWQLEALGLVNRLIGLDSEVATARLFVRDLLKLSPSLREFFHLAKEAHTSLFMLKPDEYTPHL